MLWELFVTFLKIGIVSFGGGYAVIPLIQHESSSRHWLTGSEYTEIVSLAGMAPGPIATNSATLIGYHMAHLPGALVSTVGMVLPSLAVVILMSAIFFRLQDNEWLKSSLYGLRPIITGTIVYAAIHFWDPGGGKEGFTWVTAATLLIAAGAMIAMIKYKLHPYMVIVASGFAGIILF